MQHAFNLASRGDMVHTVADKLPTLLPYVLMAYQQRSPLVNQRADGSHDALWREAMVRQGDPMGPLLFALTFQPTLHAAQEHAANAVVTACHDSTYHQGQQGAVVAGARRIMSRPMHATHHRCWYTARTPTRPGASPPSSGQPLQRAALSHAGRRPEVMRS